MYIFWAALTLTHSRTFLIVVDVVMPLSSLQPLLPPPLLPLLLLLSSSSSLFHSHCMYTIHAECSAARFFPVFFFPFYARFALFLPFYCYCCPQIVLCLHQFDNSLEFKEAQMARTCQSQSHYIRYNCCNCHDYSNSFRKKTKSFNTVDATNISLCSDVVLEKHLFLVVEKKAFKLGRL